MKDFRDYDVHETGHVELSGMTQEELIEWENKDKEADEQG